MLSNIDETRGGSAAHRARTVPQPEHLSGSRNESSYCLPVAESQPLQSMEQAIPPASMSWGSCSPYFGGFYNYYQNKPGYDHHAFPQYANQYATPSNTQQGYHSASVLQCCDPRCRLMSADHAKYQLPTGPAYSYQKPRRKSKASTYLPVNSDPCNLHKGSTRGNGSQYSSTFAPHFQNDSRYGTSQMSSSGVPLRSSHVVLPSGPTFSDYYPDISSTSYWNQQNEWRKNSASYYASAPKDCESSHCQPGLLFNKRGLDNPPIENSYVSDYYPYCSQPPTYTDDCYRSHNPNPHPGTSLTAPHPHGNFYEVNRMAPNNNYQLGATCDMRYLSNVPNSELNNNNANAVTKNPQSSVKSSELGKILEKRPHLDVREFLSTWEDVDDDKPRTPAATIGGAPVIVLNCPALDGNPTQNDDTCVDKGLSKSATLSTISGITRQTDQCFKDLSANNTQNKIEAHSTSAELVSKPRTEHHTQTQPNGDWNKGDDFVSMTERLVNTVDKLFNETSNTTNNSKSSRRYSINKTIEPSSMNISDTPRNKSSHNTIGDGEFENNMKIKVAYQNELQKVISDPVRRSHAKASYEHSISIRQVEHPSSLIAESAISKISPNSLDKHPPLGERKKSVNVLNNLYELSLNYFKDNADCRVSHSRTLSDPFLHETSAPTTNINHAVVGSSDPWNSFVKSRKHRKDYNATLMNSKFMEEEFPRARSQLPHSNAEWHENLSRERQCLSEKPIDTPKIEKELVQPWSVPMDSLPNRRKHMFFPTLPLRGEDNNICQSRQYSFQSSGNLSPNVRSFQDYPVTSSILDFSRDESRILENQKILEIGKIKPYSEIDSHIHKDRTTEVLSPKWSDRSSPTRYETNNGWVKAADTSSTQPNSHDSSTSEREAPTVSSTTMLITPPGRDSSDRHSAMSVRDEYENSETFDGEGYDYTSIAKGQSEEKNTKSPLEISLSHIDSCSTGKTEIISKLCDNKETTNDRILTFEEITEDFITNPSKSKSHWYNLWGSDSNNATTVNSNEPLNLAVSQETNLSTNKICMECTDETYLDEESGLCISKKESKKMLMDETIENESITTVVISEENTKFLEYDFPIELSTDSTRHQKIEKYISEEKICESMNDAALITNTNKMPSDSSESMKSELKVENEHINNHVSKTRTQKLVIKKIKQKRKSTPRKSESTNDVTYVCYPISDKTPQNERSECLKDEPSESRLMNSPESKSTFQPTNSPIPLNEDHEICLSSSSKTESDDESMLIINENPVIEPSDTTPLEVPDESSTLISDPLNSTSCGNKDMNDKNSDDILVESILIKSASELVDDLLDNKSDVLERRDDSSDLTGKEKTNSGDENHLESFRQHLDSEVAGHEDKDSYDLPTELIDSRVQEKENNMPNDDEKYSVSGEQCKVFETAVCEPLEVNNQNHSFGMSSPERDCKNQFPLTSNLVQSDSTNLISSNAGNVCTEPNDISRSYFNSNLAQINSADISDDDKLILETLLTITIERNNPLPACRSSNIDTEVTKDDTSLLYSNTHTSIKSKICEENTTENTTKNSVPNPEEPILRLQSPEDVDNASVVLKAEKQSTTFNLKTNECERNQISTPLDSDFDNNIAKHSSTVIPSLVANPAIPKSDNSIGTDSSSVAQENASSDITSLVSNNIEKQRIENTLNLCPDIVENTDHFKSPISNSVHIISDRDAVPSLMIHAPQANKEPTNNKIAINSALQENYPVSKVLRLEYNKSDNTVSNSENVASIDSNSNICQSEKSIENVIEKSISSINEADISENSIDENIPVDIEAETKTASEKVLEILENTPSSSKLSATSEVSKVTEVKNNYLDTKEISIHNPDVFKSPKLLEKLSKRKILRSKSIDTALFQKLYSNDISSSSQKTNNYRPNDDSNLVTYDVSYKTVRELQKLETTLKEPSVNLFSALEPEFLSNRRITRARRRESLCASSAVVNDENHSSTILSSKANKLKVSKFREQLAENFDSSSDNENEDSSQDPTFSFSSKLHGKSKSRYQQPYVCPDLCSKSSSIPLEKPDKVNQSIISECKDDSKSRVANNDVALKKESSKHFKRSTNKMDDEKLSKLHSKPVEKNIPGESEKCHPLNNQDITLEVSTSNDVKNKIKIPSEKEVEFSKGVSLNVNSVSNKLDNKKKFAESANKKKIEDVSATNNSDETASKNLPVAYFCATNSSVTKIATVLTNRDKRKHPDSEKSLNIVQQPVSNNREDQSGYQKIDTKLDNTRCENSSLNETQQTINPNTTPHHDISDNPMLSQDCDEKIYSSKMHPSFSDSFKMPENFEVKNSLVSTNECDTNRDTAFSSESDKSVNSLRNPSILEACIEPRILEVSSDEINSTSSSKNKKPLKNESHFDNNQIGILKISADDSLKKRKSCLGIICETNSENFSFDVKDVKQASEKKNERRKTSHENMKPDIPMPKVNKMSDVISGKCKTEKSVENTLNNESEPTSPTCKMLSEKIQSIDEKTNLLNNSIQKKKSLESIYNENSSSLLRDLKRKQCDSKGTRDDFLIGSKSEGSILGSTLGKISQLKARRSSCTIERLNFFSDERDRELNLRAMDVIKRYDKASASSLPQYRAYDLSLKKLDSIRKIDDLLCLVGSNQSFGKNVNLDNDKLKIQSDKKSSRLTNRSMSVNSSLNPIIIDFEKSSAHSEKSTQHNVINVSKCEKSNKSFPIPEKSREKNIKNSSESSKDSYSFKKHLKSSSHSNSKRDKEELRQLLSKSLNDSYIRNSDKSKVSSSQVMRSQLKRNIVDVDELARSILTPHKKNPKLSKNIVNVEELEQSLQRSKKLKPVVDVNELASSLLAPSKKSVSKPEAEKTYALKVTSPSFPSHSSDFYQFNQPASEETNPKENSDLKENKRSSDKIITKYSRFDSSEERKPVKFELKSKSKLDMSKKSVTFAENIFSVREFNVDSNIPESQLLPKPVHGKSVNTSKTDEKDFTKINRTITPSTWTNPSYHDNCSSKSNIPKSFNKIKPKNQVLVNKFSDLTPSSTFSIEPSVSLKNSHSFDLSSTLTACLPKASAASMSQLLSTSKNLSHNSFKTSESEMISKASPPISNQCVSEKHSAKMELQSIESPAEQQPDDEFIYECIENIDIPPKTNLILEKPPSELILKAVPSLKAMAMNVISTFTFTSNVNNFMQDALEVKVTRDKTEITVHSEKTGVTQVTDVRVFDTDGDHHSLFADCDLLNDSEKNKNLLEEKNIPKQYIIINDKAVICLHKPSNSAVIVNSFEDNHNEINSENVIEEQYIDEIRDICKENTENNNFESHINTSKFGRFFNDSMIRDSSMIKPHLKVQIPWDRVLGLNNLKESLNSADEVELGPAKIEVRFSAEENGSLQFLKPNNDQILNINRLILKPAQNELSHEDIESMPTLTPYSCESDKASCTVPVSPPKTSPPELTKEVDESCKEINTGNSSELIKYSSVTTNPTSVVITLSDSSHTEKYLPQCKSTKYTACKKSRLIDKLEFAEMRRKWAREYEEYLKRRDHFQPSVQLIRDKQLDEFAEKFYGRSSSKKRIFDPAADSNSVPEKKMCSLESNDTSKSIVSSVPEDESYFPESNTSLISKSDSSKSSSSSDDEASDDPTSEYHFCSLCSRNFNSEQAYEQHMNSKEHKRLDVMQRKTIHAVYRHFTGQMCPSLKPVGPKERKLVTKPRKNHASKYHIHEATPLKIALKKSKSEANISAAKTTQKEEEAKEQS